MDANKFAINKVHMNELPGNRGPTSFCVGSGGVVPGCNEGAMGPLLPAHIQQGELGSAGELTIEHCAHRQVSWYNHVIDAGKSENRVVLSSTLMLHRAMLWGQLLVLRQRGWRRARWLSPVLSPLAELLHLGAIRHP